MMKIQRFVLSSAVGLTAFGAGVGLIELGNYLREVFVAPKLGVKLSTLPPHFAEPVYAPERILEKPLVFVPKVEPAEEPEFEWGETGDYFIAGKKPKGFEDFDSLAIVTREWSDEKQRIVDVKPYGSLQTFVRNDYGKQYEFSAINITGKRISIVTRSLKGVSYQFDGKFVLEEYKVKLQSGEEYPDAVLLKGRLTKWKGGKKIAEAKLNFEVGGC